jgi:drug/metabolite transporter (DMT)-like permease
VTARSLSTKETAAPMTSMNARGRLWAYAIPYVVLAAFLYELTKDGLRYSSPEPFMAMRFLLASLVTFVFARSFRPQLNKDTLVLGVFTFISSTLWCYGLQRISAAQSAVITYTMPLFAIPLSILILKEKPSRLGWAGAFVGFVGITLYGLSLTGSGSTLAGELLTLGNAVFWGLYSVYYRKTRNQDALRTVGTQLLICGVLFSLFSPFAFAVSFTPEFLLDLGFVSTLGTCGSFLLWNTMLRREKVGRITTLAFAVPATITVFEVVQTNTIPSFLTVSGICLMFFGIFISRFRDIPIGNHPAARTEPPSSGVLVTSED